MAYSDVVLAKSPALYLRLGEASGLPQDSSANALHMETTVGTPTYSQPGALSGDANTAISFTTADRFQRTDAAALDLGDVLTIEAWVKRLATGANHGIISKDTNAYYLRFSSDNTLGLYKANISVIISSTTTVTDTTSFHHCVATKNGATVKLYIDAVDVSGTPASVTLENNTGPLFLNALFGGGEQGNHVLDEVALYPTALSAAQVQENYNAATRIPIRSQHLDYDYSR